MRWSAKGPGVHGGGTAAATAGAPVAIAVGPTAGPNAAVPARAPTALRACHVPSGAAAAGLSHVVNDQIVPRRPTVFARHAIAGRGGPRRPTT
jgi:hypothetical protein